MTGFAWHAPPLTRVFILQHDHLELGATAAEEPRMEQPLLGSEPLLPWIEPTSYHRSGGVAPTLWRHDFTWE